MVRGKWVLENLLGAPPPPPPPNVPPLKENDGKSKPTALRERMEAAPRQPGLRQLPRDQWTRSASRSEHYDAIGKWHDRHSGAEINSTITWSGRTVDNPLRIPRGAAGSRTRDEFIRTVVEKLLTYALGRGVDFSDAPVVRQLILISQTKRWSTLRPLTSSRRRNSRCVEPRAPNGLTPAARTSVGAQQQH